MVAELSGETAAVDRLRLETRRDTEEARRINARLLESFDYETGDLAPNPVPTKAMLRTLGLAVGEPRLPMGPTPEGLEDTAREVYARLKA